MVQGHLELVEGYAVVDCEEGVRGNVAEDCEEEWGSLGGLLLQFKDEPRVEVDDGFGLAALAEEAAVEAVSFEAPKGSLPPLSIGEVFLEV